MKRAPHLQNLLDNFSKAAFGKTNSEAVGENVCVICHGPAAEFSNELSRKEFGISGMCEGCQNEFFTDEE